MTASDWSLDGTMMWSLSIAISIQPIGLAITVNNRHLAGRQ